MRTSYATGRIPSTRTGRRYGEKRLVNSRGRLRSDSERTTSCRTTPAGRAVATMVCTTSRPFQWWRLLHPPGNSAASVRHDGRSVDAASSASPILQGPVSRTSCA
jgi:hypothetical protein